MNIKKFLIGAAAGALMLGATIIPSFAAPNLVGWWKLDGNAADSSTYANNGTAVGGVTWVAGEDGQAAQLDGSTGYISVPNNVSLQITGHITVDGWININSLSDQATVVSKWYDLNGVNDRGYLLAVHNDGTPRFYISTDGVNYPAAVGPAITLGAWHHLVGTYDGSNIQLYVDGVLVATQPQTGAIFNSSQGLLIGANDGFGGSNRKFTNGIVDDVKIYNVSLGEITPTPTLVGPPTNKNQCKDGGWKTFNNPTFKNQGQCVEYVEHHNGKGHDDDKDHDGHGNNTNHHDD